MLKRFQDIRQWQISKRSRLYEGDNVSDYIKREDAMRAITKVDCDDVVAKMAVGSVPAADVVEVKHGKWEVRTVRGVAVLYCSACGSSTDVIYEYTFCPNCGAKMNLEN